MLHATPHPDAGKTVTVTPHAVLFGHADTSPLKITIEDWNDRVFGRSWMYMEGHPASLGYAMRSVAAALPLDNEVVYGHDERGLGHLLHTSEILDGGEQ
jgi:acetylornithine deacetylase/succinyl-diaminopimelate desuccinylase-like protein